MKQHQRSTLLFTLVACLLSHQLKGAIGGAVELTLSNFEDTVSGKSVFIKASHRGRNFRM
jgi:hypothetical protein